MCGMHIWEIEPRVVIEVKDFCHLSHELEIPMAEIARPIDITRSLR
jgi:hypothetical protein